MRLIGDLNQRYAVMSNGHPNEGWQAVGWSDSLVEAEHMEKQAKNEPGCTNTSIQDRGVTGGVESTNARR